MLHELGHFATAKWSGMKVTEYFVGFGPRLWSIRRGETEYGVKAIPAGGYVRITGFTVLEDVADRGRAAHLSPAAVLEADHRRLGRLGHALPHRLRPGTDQRFRVRGGDRQRRDRLARALGRAWRRPRPSRPASKLATPSSSVNGQPLARPNTVHDVITRSVGNPVTLGVERDGHLRAASSSRPQDGRGVQGRRPHAGPGERQDAAGLHRHRRRAGLGIGEPAARRSATRQPIWARPRRRSSRALVHVFSPSGVSSIYHQVTNSHDGHGPGGRQPDHIGTTGLADRRREHRRPGAAPGRPVPAGAPDRHQYRLRPARTCCRSCRSTAATWPWPPTNGSAPKKGQPYYQADITKLFPYLAPFLGFLALFAISVVFLDIAHPIQ